MAGTTFRIGRYVAWILALGNRVVVATRAFPENIRMIIAAIRIELQKMRSVVAAITLGVGRCMKFRFPDCYHTIVAFTACTKNFLMIYRGDDVKTRGGMTGMAVVTGRNMTGQFSGCGNAVVARVTAINNAGMVKHRGGKSTRYVTGATILTGRDMAGMLADRTTCTTVMAGVTPFTDDFRVGMVNICVSEINGVMASSAILTCA